MSAIAALAGVQPAAGGARAEGPRAMGQEDFLLLLVTQLKAQDPLNPMDNSQFVAQLAQFSTVAGIAEMNSGLNRLATALDGQAARAAAPQWIGRAVAAEGGEPGVVQAVSFAAGDGQPVLELSDGRRLPLSSVAVVA